MNESSILRMEASSAWSGPMSLLACWLGNWPRIFIFDEVAVIAPGIDLFIHPGLVYPWGPVRVPWVRGNLVDPPARPVFLGDPIQRAFGGRGIPSNDDPTIRRFAIYERCKNSFGSNHNTVRIITGFIPQNDRMPPMQPGERIGLLGLVDVLRKRSSREPPVLGVFLALNALTLVGEELRE